MKKVQKFKSVMKKIIITNEKDKTLFELLPNIFTSQEASDFWKYSYETTKAKLNLFKAEGKLTKINAKTWRKI